MKNVGIITFHAAHNYGSVLQAYALKTYIQQLGCNCEIINFRTERQKDQYRPFTKRKGLKYIFKNAYFLLNYKSRKAKYDRFEDFINSKLVKNQNEYLSLEELKNAGLSFDYYISGSDQIWNTVPNDADDAYFLPFVESGKRIAYAPSFGQFGTINNADVIESYLNDYDFLSIREKHGQDLIENLISQSVPIIPDPTLLFDKSQWDELICDRIIKEKYVFFYTLFASPQMISIVKTISNNLHMPVVISNVSNQYEIFSGFKKVTDAGPMEFLSLIKYADFVCVTSFHGTVFSILMHKPFYCINGLDDDRISTLLKNTGLSERSVSQNDIDNKMSTAFNINYDVVDENIEKYKEKGVKYLKTALELERINDTDL